MTLDMVERRIQGLKRWQGEKSQGAKACAASWLCVVGGASSSWMLTTDLHPNIYGWMRIGSMTMNLAVCHWTESSLELLSSYDRLLR